MVSAEVDICNMALIRVGAKRIISLDDDTKAALLCKQYYEQTRDEVLREHEWNCATERASLARLSEAPAYGFEYAYQLPASPFCLKVIEMESQDYWPYKVEGRKLLTDNEECNIRYTKKMENPAEMDSYLVECIALRLATHLCESLSADANKTQALLGEYLVALQKAVAQDSDEWKQDDAEEQADQNPWWEDEAR
jgi:hypothetical protein